MEHQRIQLCTDAEMGLVESLDEPQPEPHQLQLQSREEEDRSSPGVVPSSFQSSVAASSKKVCTVALSFLCAAVLGTAAALRVSSMRQHPNPDDLDFPLVARATFDTPALARDALVGRNLDVMGRGRRTESDQVEGTFLLHDRHDWSALEGAAAAAAAAGASAVGGGEGRVVYDEVHTALMKLDESESSEQQDYHEVDSSSNINNSRRLSYTTMSSRPCYRTVDATDQTMADIVTDHPTLATIQTIGTSENGENIQILKLTSPLNPTSKSPMFITAGLHAREYAPPELLTRLAEYLVEAYGTDADATWILDHVELSLLLQANPDSRRIAEQNVLSQQPRKNQNGDGKCSSTALGTDLNRNFDFMWGLDAGSSNDPCSITYRGKSAESESETQAIAAYSRSLFDASQRKNDPIGDVDDAYNENSATGLYVDVHAYGNDMIFPWGFQNDEVGNIAGYKAITHKLSKINKYVPSGSEYNFLGTTSGDTLDYHHGALGVPSILYEVGSSWSESCASFESTVLPDNMRALIYSAKLAPLPFKLAKGPDVLDLNVEVSTKSDTTIASVVVTARASDNEMTQLGHTNDPDIDTELDTGTQSIGQVSAFVDGHPYDTTPVPASTLMEALDGNFNSPTEGVTLTLDTSNLEVGRHTVCVEAIDTDGYRGPVSCQYFDLACTNIGDEGECTENAECHWKSGKAKCVDLCQGRSNSSSCLVGHEGRCGWDSTEQTCYRIS